MKETLSIIAPSEALEIPDPRNRWRASKMENVTPELHPVAERRSATNIAWHGVTPGGNELPRSKKVADVLWNDLEG